MLTQGFYYFLLIGEIAILGLIMTGIVYKVKTIINLYSVQADDQNYEHFVSGSDQSAQAKSDIYHDCTTGLAPVELKSGHIPWTSH
jgi:hypothetical protein